jgi:hypothetical protein
VSSVVHRFHFLNSQDSAAEELLCAAGRLGSVRFEDMHCCEINLREG